MTWLQFSHGLWQAPSAEQSPKVLAVLLHDATNTIASLTTAVTRWAPNLIATTFIAPTEAELPQPTANGLSPSMPASEVPEKPGEVERAARLAAPQLERQLRFYHLDASRLVLVGFGHGGRLALHLLLQGRCAGALTFAARLTRPLPRIGEISGKVRLVEYAGADHSGYSGMRNVMTSLVARGVDARGVVLGGAGLSDEAIRHGGAYLCELVATAQRSHRFRGDGESAGA
ncbi:MAG TPA: hypothetical protein VND94_06065 [Terriglobia bacterium]|nr:hypothetical protein [Terriglobia bacterium]